MTDKEFDNVLNGYEKSNPHYMDIYTGECFTFEQAYAKYVEEYDGGDPCNTLDFWDYFDWVK